MLYAQPNISNRRMNSRVRFAPAVLLVVVQLLFACSLALASEGTHAASHGSFSDLRIYWVNFLIYAAILFFLLKNPFVSFWINRRNKIESDVIGGKIEIDAAEKKIADARHKMDLIGEEIEHVRESMEHDTERECQELVEAARVRAQRISQRMRESCVAEQHSAEGSIRKEITEMALNMARRQLTQEVNSESDRAFREAALSGVGGLLH